MTMSTRVALVTIFMALTATGGWLAAQNKCGTPKTIIHVSAIQWKESVSAADRKQGLDSVKDTAAKIPGIKKRLDPRPCECSGRDTTMHS